MPSINKVLPKRYLIYSLRFYLHNTASLAQRAWWLVLKPFRGPGDKEYVPACLGVFESTRCRHSRNSPSNYTCITVLQNYPNIPVKANCKQNTLKLTASKIGTCVMVQVITLTLQYYKFIQSYPNIPMKANCKQNALKVTASKIGTCVMVQVIALTLQCYKFIQSYPNIPMKANCKQKTLKLTASKMALT